MIIPKLKKDLKRVQHRLKSFIKKQEAELTAYPMPITPSNTIKCLAECMYSNFAYVNDSDTTDNIVMYDTIRIKAIWS